MRRCTRAAEQLEPRERTLCSAHPCVWSVWGHLARAAHAAPQAPAARSGAMQRTASSSSRHVAPRRLSPRRLSPRAGGLASGRPRSLLVLSRAAGGPAGAGCWRGPEHTRGESPVGRWGCSSGGPPRGEVSGSRFWRIARRPAPPPEVSGSSQRMSSAFAALPPEVSGAAFSTPVQPFSRPALPPRGECSARLQLLLCPSEVSGPARGALWVGCGQVSGSLSRFQSRAGRPAAARGGGALRGWVLCVAGGVRVRVEAVHHHHNHHGKHGC